VCILSASCGTSSPQVPKFDAYLVVYVHWGSMGLAQKRIEVVELSVVKLTDTSGIAEFTLPAGSYTLRAYGINTPGPPPAYVDFAVKTTPGDTTRVDVVDCLVCLRAN